MQISNVLPTQQYTSNTVNDSIKVNTQSTSSTANNAENANKTVFKPVDNKENTRFNNLRSNLEKNKSEEIAEEASPREQFQQKIAQDIKASFPPNKVQSMFREQIEKITKDFIEGTQQDNNSKKSSETKEQVPQNTKEFNENSIETTKEAVIQDSVELKESKSEEKQQQNRVDEKVDTDEKDTRLINIEREPVEAETQEEPPLPVPPQDRSRQNSASLTDIVAKDSNQNVLIN